MMQKSACRRTITVNLENGLHLIPGSLIAQLARQFDCQLTIRNGDITADAKNVLDIIALGAAFGAKLELETKGADAAEAMEKVLELFNANFEVDQTSHNPE